MNSWIVLIVILFLVFAKRKRENFFGTSLKNIYGEPLKECRKYKGDERGSWDVEGYCSEQCVNTGLHQICFNLNDNTKNFSAIILAAEESTPISECVNVLDFANKYSYNIGFGTNVDKLK